MVSSTTASSSSSFARRIPLKEVVLSSRSFLLVTSVVDTIVVGILLLFLLTPMSFVWLLDVFLTGSTRLIASIVLAKRLWSFWFIRNGVATQDSMMSTITVPIVYLMILGRGLPEVCGNPPDENWSVCGSIVYCKLASPFRTVLYIIIQPVRIDLVRDTWRRSFNWPEIYDSVSWIALDIYFHECDYSVRNFLHCYQNFKFYCNCKKKQSKGKKWVDDVRHLKSILTLKRKLNQRFYTGYYRKIKISLCSRYYT